MNLDSREREIYDAAQVARLGQGCNVADGLGQLGQVAIAELAAKRAVPHGSGHAKARVGPAHMMDQMMAAESCLEEVGWIRVVDPVMEKLIRDETANDSRIEDHARRPARPEIETEPYDDGWRPCAQRKHRAGVLVMS